MVNYMQRAIPPIPTGPAEARLEWTHAEARLGWTESSHRSASYFTCYQPRRHWQRSLHKALHYCKALGDRSSPLEHTTLVADRAHRWWKLKDAIGCLHHARVGGRPSTEAGSGLEVIFARRQLPEDPLRPDGHHRIIESPDTVSRPKRFRSQPSWRLRTDQFPRKGKFPNVITG